MSDPGKAVFLSYASQDTEAAKRICEALRVAGVEVWFDQSELVGGDAWDQKIRKQIKDCALLIPVISQNTQARAEGYFRLEWRLADQRTHLMGRSKAFLMPVAIDGTTDADADVPDSFTAVQWTKAPGGEVPPAFAARVKQLLDGGPGSREAGMGGLGTASQEPGPPREKRGPSKWWWALPMFGVAMALALVMKEGRKGPVPAAPVATPPAGSETDQLVRQARELVYDPDSARNEFALAENLLKRATDLAPASGGAWGASALLNHYFYSRAYDNDRQRLVRSQAEAEKALRLDPRNTDALLALGLHRQVLGDKDRAQDYLDRALAADPQNFKAILAQSQQLSDHQAKARFLLEAADHVARPAELFYYAAIELGYAWRFAEAKPICERAIAAQPFWRTFVQRAVIEESQTADPVRMNQWLDKVPELKRDEPRVAFMRFGAAKLQRDGAAALRALNSLAADYLEDSFYTGPRAFLLAQAQELAGQPGLAAEQWELAERAIRPKLAADPGDIRLRAMLAVSLAGRHRLAEARTVAEACTADDRLKGNTPALEVTADACARLGEPDRAIALLRLIPLAAIHNGGVYAANLGTTPQWDTLRDRPGYAQLLAELKRAEHAAPGEPSAGGGDSSFAKAMEDKSGLPAAPDLKSVAVLAFANLSDDKANEYFSDGISEELLNVLAKIPNLKVAARTSAFYFKGKEVPIPEIAKQLGVAYVVEGSVRKQGDKVRITAQLIKAADGFHVWSDTFTRDIKDVFAVQDEIAGLIAKNLELKMGMAAVVPHGAINAEAYQAYLLGRAAAAKASMADFKVAVGHFKQAVALEPKFAAAWVQLAGAHTQLGRWGGAPPLESWREARIAIDRAKELEPDSPDMLLALGWIRRTGDWDWRGAEQAFRRALELRPGHPETLAGLAVLLFNVGQTAEAFRLGQEAVRLDPLNPSAQIDLSIMFHFNRDWVEAERTARRALQLAPGGTGFHSILAWSLIPQRRFAEAKAEIDLETDLVEAPMNYGLLAIARGDPAEARRRIAEMEELARTRGDVSDLQQSMAWLYAPLGEKDRAFAALEKARASRDPSMSWLRNSYYLEALFTDPRWPELLRKVGLADEQLK